MKRTLPASILAVTLLMSLLAGCGPKTASYKGQAEGNNGTVTVKVVMEGETIKEVTVVDQQETEGLADGALENVPKAIVEQQSLAVDGVSGATVTSDAIKAAVENAIATAGLDVSKYK